MSKKMSGWHTNPETGNSALCSADSDNPRSTGCRFKLSSDEHYPTREAAEAAFAKMVEEPSFAVIVSDRGSNENMRVVITDASLKSRVESLEKDWGNLSVGEKSERLNDLFDKYSETATNIHNMEYGSKSRLEALKERNKVREEIFAADIVAWRDSDFYSEDVEKRMEDNALYVSDADLCIEEALSNRAGIEAVARENGISPRDVENILETIHDDYLKPRFGIAKSIGKLEQDSQYAESTAHVFRIDSEAVRNTIKFARKYSTVKV